MKILYRIKYWAYCLENRFTVSCSTFCRHSFEPETYISLSFPHALNIAKKSGLDASAKFLIIYKRIWDIIRAYLLSLLLSFTQAYHRFSNVSINIFIVILLFTFLLWYVQFRKLLNWYQRLILHYKLSVTVMTMLNI